MQIKVVRKQVARILTLMRERELEELEAQAIAGAEEA